MKLSAIQHLITIVERGSIRAAARHLDIAQPVLTRSIQELERELKTVLLERGKKGVHLTAMGQVFLRRATIATGELRRAQDELAQLRGETHGSLSVGMSMASQITLLPTALRQFRQRYPDVSLSIIDTLFPGIEGALKEGRVDIYVGPVLGDPPSGLAAEQIFEIERVIFCRKGHPLAESRSLRDLINAEWMTTSIASKAEEEMGPIFAQHGLPAPRLVMHAHAGLTYMIGLANSDMLVVLPESWMRLAQWKDMFHMIPIQEALPKRPICIVQRHGLPLTPAAEYFCDMLRREAAHIK
jgi:LysR family transcriptional regulator, regulator of abg operon